jgi:UDP-glucose 4-epimerase
MGVTLFLVYHTRDHCHPVMPAHAGIQGQNRALAGWFKTAMMPAMNVLVTGGAGYVGSHSVRALCAEGHQVTVLDNLCAGHRAAVDDRATLIVGDMGDDRVTGDLLSGGRFHAVMHFAAHIEVGESVKHPLKFYENNIANTVRLLMQMERHGPKRFIFSSTCAVFGVPDSMPITENMPRQPESPYARVKLAIEWALADSCAAWGLGFAALRYFNAAGAAADATIGEDHDPETHLIPNVLKVALGQRDKIMMFGTDYDTPDGTCIRDYVHVADLARAHVAALDALRPGEQRFYNTGTGIGASVREVVEAARAVTGHAIPVEECPRRPGDVPRLYADPSRIRGELGWQPQYTDLREIVASAWKWHASHPNGFDDRA